MMQPYYAGPVIALIAGILILIQPRLLNYIVAIYLIIIGILGIDSPLSPEDSWEAHLHVL